MSWLCCPAATAAAVAVAAADDVFGEAKSTAGDEDTADTVATSESSYSGGVEERDLDGFGLGSREISNF